MFFLNVSMEEIIGLINVNFYKWFNFFFDYGKLDWILYLVEWKWFFIFFERNICEWVWNFIKIKWGIKNCGDFFWFFLLSFLFNVEIDG